MEQIEPLFGIEALRDQKNNLEEFIDAIVHNRPLSPELSEALNERPIKKRDLTSIQDELTEVENRIREIEKL